MSGSSGTVGFLSLLSEEDIAAKNQVYTNTKKSTRSKSRGSIVPDPVAQEKLSSGLAVGFLSLLASDEALKATPPPAIKKEKSNTIKKLGSGPLLDVPKPILGSLQSLSTKKYSPVFTLEGVLKKRNKGVWKEYFCYCNLAGVLEIRKNENSEKIRKKYTLKGYSLTKCSDNQFTLRNIEKEQITVFKANSEAEVDQWIPTLAQYTSEMFTYLQIESFTLPILVWNEREIIMGVNKACEKLLGYERDDLLGRNICEVMPPEKCSSNQSIYRYTKQKSPLLLDLVTLVNKVHEDIYLLVNFGEYIEDGNLRFIASFKQTGNDKKDTIRTTTYKDVGKGLTIDWISWSNDCI